MLIKIGHTANKQSERIEMEVSTVGGGAVLDWHMCQFVYHSWPAGRLKKLERKKKEKKKQFCSLLAIMQRSVAIFDTWTRHCRSFQWHYLHEFSHHVEEKSYWGGCVLYLVKIGLEKSLMSAALHDSTPLRLRGIKSLEAIHPRQTARSVTSAPLMLTTPRTSRRPQFFRH